MTQPANFYYESPRSQAAATAESTEHSGGTELPEYKGIPLKAALTLGDF